MSWRDDFWRLSGDSDITPQQRGRAFEHVLYEMFEEAGLQPRGSYRPVGEEIDGSLWLHGRTILFEAKWTFDPVSASQLHAFRGKLDGKLVGTLGIFISMAGFSKDAMDALRVGKAINMILLGGDDLRLLASAHGPPIEPFLTSRLRLAGDEGRPYQRTPHVQRPHGRSLHSAAEVPGGGAVDLSKFRINWALSGNDIWTRLEGHVPELHRHVLDDIFDGARQAWRAPEVKSVGVVVTSHRRGSGLTHLLGVARERVQHEEDGYFFLPSVYGSKGFWETLAWGITNDLQRRGTGDMTQLQTFLWRLTAKLAMTSSDRREICGLAPLTTGVLTRLRCALRDQVDTAKSTIEDTAQATAMMGSPDLSVQDAGYAYLYSLDDPNLPAWGLPATPEPAETIVQNIFQLLALTGPIIIAFDQLESMFLNVSIADNEERRTLARIAQGFVELCRQLPRTVVILACLTNSWTHMQIFNPALLETHFRETALIGPIQDPALARQVVKQRLRAYWNQMEFSPPGDIWPLTESTIGATNDRTARELLRWVDEAVRKSIACPRLAPR